MARAHFVKAARKAYPEAGINKGDSYWWWQFRHGPKRRSKTRPRASQLTQSAYLSTLYGLREQVEDFALPDDGTEKDKLAALKEFIDNLRPDVEGLGEECQNSLDNMPDSLQDGDTGQMLQERIDSCEEAASELDSIIDRCDEAMETEEDEAESAEDLISEVSEALNQIHES